MTKSRARDRWLVPSWFWLRVVARAAAWALLLWAIAAGLGIAGRIAWFAEIPANFSILIAAAAIGGLLILFLFGNRASRAGAIAFAIFAAASWILTKPSSSAIDGAGGPQVSVMTWNACVGSIDPHGAAQEIFRLNPDVVAFTEFTIKFRDAIDPLLLARYPYHLESASKGFTGVGVYSRLPISDWQRNRSDSRPRATCRLEIPGWGACRLLLLHPNVPVREGFAMRAASLGAATDELSAIDEPTIVLGDFNASWASADLRRFCETNDLRVASRLHPTWNATYPWFLRTAIDHILVPRTRFSSVSAVVGNTALGGDHFPVMAILEAVPMGVNLSTN